MADLSVQAFWYHLIVQLNYSLSVASRYDPAKAADTYLTALLSKDSVQIVDLNDIRLVRRILVDPSAKEYLPPMPEEEDDSEEQADTAAKPSGWTGMLWNAVGWLFGSSAYEGVKERPESCYNKGSALPASAVAKPMLPINRYSRQLDGDEVTLADDSASFQRSRRAAAVEGHSWNPLVMLGRWFSGGSTEAVQSRDLEKTAVLLPSAPATPTRNRIYHDETGRTYTSPFASNPLHPDYHSPTRARPMFSDSDTTLRAPARASLDAGPSIQGSRSAPSLLAQQQIFRGLPQLPNEELDRIRLLAQPQHPGPAMPQPVLYDPYRHPDESFSDYDDFVRRHVEQAHDERSTAGPSDGPGHTYVQILDGHLVRKLSTILSESERLSSRHTSQASLAAIAQRQAQYAPSPGRRSF